MIHRFRKVTDGLFRGSAPSPQDVAWLKDHIGIKKIISLDDAAGQRIDRVTKLLGIKHIMLPVDIVNLRSSLLNLLKYNLKKLLIDGGPTYVHCAAGKDRTGLLIALYQCKYMGKDPEKAIQEAKSLGFGLDVDPKMISIFEKLIRSCKSSEDNNNNVDIVSNEREYIGDSRDSYLDEGHQSSFAPYLDVTKTNLVYNPINDQSPTRENYKSIKEHNYEEKDVIPQVGVYNNEAGGRGFGPTENAGGFIYD